MKIHKTSIIEDGAKLGSNVSIGPYSHIGKNVILGDNVVIQGYCEIGVHSFGDNKKLLQIGDNSLIRSKSIFYTGSTFGPKLITGHNVTVRENVIAGKNLQSLFGTNDYDEMLKKEIQKVKDRLSKQKGVRKGLLQELQQETLRREQAKVAAAQTMQDSNRTNKTGGYQAGYSRDFMEGPSGGDISGQSGGLGGNQGGAGGTATMGSFAEGGLASLLID